MPSAASTSEGVYILEIAARPIGGLCSRALRFTMRREAGSLEDVLLRHAVGEHLDDVARESTRRG